MKTSERMRSRGRGFTLVELLVVITVLGVLVGISAPAMSGMIRSVRLTSATNDLFASLLLARSEAAKRNARVTMCKSRDGQVCATTGGWEQGWIVFHDVDNSGTHDRGEQIMFRAQPLSPDLRLGGNLNIARYVSYSPTGAAKLVGGGFQAGTFTLCNESAKSSEGRQIILSYGGRARVQKMQVPTCF